jgi:hypothetical protein
MNSDPLHLVLTFDAEADVFDGSIGAAAAPGWRGIDEGIPQILEMLAGYSDGNGAALRSTWFVRTDREIAGWHGDAAFLLRRYAAFWRSRLAAGDEIGFHPHFSRQAQAEASGAMIRREIADALKAARGAGYDPVSSRLGEAFGSNAALATLEDFGFETDSTAMPGRVRRDADRCLDWSGTPARPYHPAVADYRVPGVPERALLEVPMSMVPVQADYDAAPFHRYVDLSFHHAALRPGLSALLATTPLLVTVTHPSTILPGIAAARHGLLSFDAGEFRRNLDLIFTECARLGREVRSITLNECPRLFTAADEPALFR